jgi:hypothetical protein
VAGAAAAVELALEEAGLADWQPVISATASMMAKQAAHFCIRRFVFFINFLRVLRFAVSTSVKHVLVAGQRQVKKSGAFTLRGNRRADAATAAGAFCA